MKISIITVNYNNSKGLEQTIQSVIKQTYINIEFIIIDGGSSDDSPQIISQYQNQITFWCSEKDSGIYNAMNKGIKKSTGDYCIFMNSGDIFYNEKSIEYIYNETHFNADIITGATIDDKNTIWFAPTDKQLTLHYLLKSSISHQATFIKRELLTQFLYSEDLKIVSDWEFWIKTLIMNNNTFISSKIIVCKYDRNGISNSPEHYHLLINERNKVISRLIPKKILSDYNYMSYSNERQHKLVQLSIKISSISNRAANLLYWICKSIIVIFLKIKKINI